MKILFSGVGNEKHFFLLSRSCRHSFFFTTFLSKGKSKKSGELASFPSKNTRKDFWLFPFLLAYFLCPLNSKHSPLICPLYGVRKGLGN
ncbi:unnamed protein product [Meloidogyne enterolobii]|uniref:Uncharacterized protein n=1 Tax=Meloidogyne enterolobii TaxID=390850 RepID=A0ACB0XL85_MELEN